MKHILSIHGAWGGAWEFKEVIERVVYVAACLPKNGETVLGLMQGDACGHLLSRIVLSED